MNKNSYVIKPVIYPMVIFLTCISLFPFYVMIIMGTYVNEELFTGLKLLPGSFLFGNFRTVFAQNFLSFYKNSLYISLLATAGGVFFCALAGFAFSKFHFRGKKVLFLFVLGTLMIPRHLGLIGFVIEMKWLGLINTHLPLIIPAMANAFGLFWMTQYIGAAIPDQLLESAEIDGSSDFRSFVSIVLPNIKPGLITIFLLFFLWSWNSYLEPLVLLNKEPLYTLPLGITLLGNMYRADFAARILALAISTLPILIMFSAGSKYLIKGLMAGSIKG